MEPVTDYTLLDPQDLLRLCVWREARGEGFEGQRAVAWSIKNRTLAPRWYNHRRVNDYPAVILMPFQYSSFNKGDANETKWPADADPSFISCTMAASEVENPDNADPTGGATNYYDRSISFPKAWGSEEEWENTLNLGRLRFFKEKPLNNSEDVRDIAND